MMLPKHGFGVCYVLFYWLIEYYMVVHLNIHKEFTAIFCFPEFVSTSFKLEFLTLPTFCMNWWYISRPGSVCHYGKRSLLPRCRENGHRDSKVYSVWQSIYFLWHAGSMFHGILWFGIYDMRWSSYVLLQNENWLAFLLKMYFFMSTCCLLLQFHHQRRRGSRWVFRLVGEDPDCKC